MFIARAILSNVQQPISSEYFMINDLIEKLSKGGPGRITHRQSTFWDLVISGSGQYRIHFQGKHEFLFLAEEFQLLAVHSNHPVLMDYHEEWRDVFFASAIQNAEPLISKMSQAVSEITDGWRSLSRYLNSALNMTSLVQSGNGLLLAAPRTIVDGVSPILAAHGVATSVLKGRPPRGSPRALIVGSSFVVAESFRVEPHPSNPPLEQAHK